LEFFVSQPQVHQLAPTSNLGRSACTSKFIHMFILAIDVSSLFGEKPFIFTKFYFIPTNC